MRLCSVDGCTNAHRARGWCFNHYMQWRRTGDPVGSARQGRRHCTVEGCAEYRHVYGRCYQHYLEAWRGGELAAAPICLIKECQAPPERFGLCADHYKEAGSGADPFAVIRALGQRGFRHKHGYWIYARTDHPNATAHQRIFEHIVVMSIHLGRPLRERENVHHRNGIRDDNRLENLELWAMPHPKGQRVTDLVEFARSILAEYDAEIAEGLHG